MKINSKNRTWIIAALLLAVAISYGLFEFNYRNGLSQEQQSVLAEKALHSATENYIHFENNFARQSRQLAEILEKEISDSTSREVIFQQINRHFDFWGVSVFKDKELWLWDGFAEKNFLDKTDSISQFVDVKRQNNVTFFSSHITFFSQNDSTKQYDLITREKIEQENILPIGQTVELDPSVIFYSNSDFPVHFSFFDTLAQNFQFKSKLSTQSIDSIGVAYTLEDGNIRYKASKVNQHTFYRTVFAVIFILLGMCFLMSFARALPVWESLLLRIFAIFAAWLLLSNLKIGMEWAEIFSSISEGNLVNIQLVFIYCLDTLFILLVSLNVFNSLYKNSILYEDDASVINPLYCSLHGFISALLLYFFVSETYELFVKSSISVIDLNVFPPFDTLIIYISSGVFSFSIITILCFTGWFLLKKIIIEWWISLLLMIVGFALGLFALSIITEFKDAFTWISASGGLFYLVIFIFTVFIYQNPKSIINSSRLRILLLIGFITVCITYISIYKGNSERLNNQMLQAAESFKVEEASEAEQIATSLLMDLEQALSGLTSQDLAERPAYVESYFTQLTHSLVSDEWESFSIATQLVNNSGDIIGEYTSDVDSPGWTRAFNIFSLLVPFEEERIRIDNLRPIVRERPLNEANSNYSTFRRGWIPLHENTQSQERVGWILCSVYRERPQFEKPLRAVIAAESNTNWSSSINVTEFIDGQPARKSIVGIPLELPGYVRLPEELLNKVKQDSIYIQTTRIGEEEIRELFIATSDNQIIRAATAHADIDNHLFSILRYFFCVLIGGLILLGALSWKKELNILDHNRHFRDRLIDRFILASLLCLMLLTVTSYYAIKNQNERNIRTELLDKVSNLVEALSQQSTTNEDSVGALEELSSALDSDASLYQNASLDISTTTQIYGQHLLPELLPWDVFNAIYNKGSNQETRKITLGNQQLLIGFQPWLNDDGEISGIVAIPTFLEAPKFNEQMLSTTSYLLGFYVLIFSLFILGAALISTQLTAPLYSLRAGLKKISGGDLETVLPVRSKDEIGSLTNAYNIMVYRLKELQQDLSKAEREAAWKEMAQQVAHEIKNPLTPMKLNLQHLERQLKVPETDFNKMKPQIEKVAANMIEQIESLNQIASDFSKFARPTQEEFETIEVNELVESVAELYASDETVTIKSELHPTEIWISGVKDEIRRALINLVKNAYEAMPNGGEITICSYVNTADSKAFISIEDEGEGISLENKKDIFVPNFSTKSSGTGLGLAITKKVIEEHNGDINFDSIPEGGTIFTVSLPLVEKEE